MISTSHLTGKEPALCGVRWQSAAATPLLTAQVARPRRKAAWRSASRRTPYMSHLTENILELNLRLLQLFVVPENSPSWPHAPEHRLSNDGTFFVTSATYQNQ